MARRAKPVPGLRTVREWLHDYFSMCEGTVMDKVLGDIAKCEVESAVDARNLVNRRIDNWVTWLNATRPTAPIDFITLTTQPRGST